MLQHPQRNIAFKRQTSCLGGEYREPIFEVLVACCGDEFKNGPPVLFAGGQAQRAAGVVVEPVG